MLNIGYIKGLFEFRHVPRMLEQTIKAKGGQLEEGRGSFLGSWPGPVSWALGDSAVTNRPGSACMEPIFSWVGSRVLSP